MASVVPLKKKFMDVQIGERQAGYWRRIPPLQALLEYFKEVITTGIQQVCRCEERKHAGVSMLLAAYMPSATTFLTRNSSMGGYASTTEEGRPSERGMLCIPDHGLSAWLCSLRNVITAEAFQILRDKMPNKR